MTTVSVTMGFFPEHIKLLQMAGHTVELGCNLDSPLPEQVEALGCEVYHIPFSRSPFSRENLTAYRELKNLLRENHYDIVHTHTPNASALVRLACRKLRRTGLRVFYTAHGFHFYTGAPLKNWLIYYPVERLLSRWTDVLITINSEDFERAKKSFCARTVRYIPGVGMDTEHFGDAEYKKGQRRSEAGIPEDALFLLSVGELNENKNHETVIRALAECPSKNVYYAVCGTGSQGDALLSLARELEVEDRVKLLGTRWDIAQWMADADIYLFPSYREGLSVSLMEAMTLGLPVLCSDIRGNRDLIKAEQGGLMCRPDDVQGFAEHIQRLKDAPELREMMGAYNKVAVQMFSREKVLKELREIYQC